MMDLTITSLAATDETVNYFGPIYVISNDGDFSGFVNAVNLWKAGFYTVYNIADQSHNLGVIHGLCRGTDFYGHINLRDNCRGKEAQQAVLETIKKITQDFGVDKVCSRVPEENRKARHFLKSIGFNNNKDMYYYGTGKFK